MRKLQWIALVPINLIFSVVCVLISPVAACFVTDDRRFLLQPFVWVETIDNDLAGDGGWQSEHLIGDDPLTWTNRIRWLWRNGANTLNYRVLGVPFGPPTFQVDAYRWWRTDGAWLYRRFLLFGSRHLELFFGWALLGPQQGRCKYVCSIRLRSKP